MDAAHTANGTGRTAVKDKQTITVDGKLTAKRIHDVEIRYAKTIPDERGTLCEMYNPAWGFHTAPLVYVYQFTIRPGKIKGWVCHKKQDDRIFVSSGTVQIVLYDARPDSPTYKLINELTFGDHNRAIFTIPAGVYHAVRNVGFTDSVCVNMPTRPYDHADPDKYRLPPENDVIDYKWR